MPGRSWRPRGDWTPAHLTRRDCTVLIAAVCVIAVLRALDYMTGQDAAPAPSRARPAAVVLGDALPLEAWGAAIMAGVLALAVGAWLRRHIVVYLGHGVLMVVYAALFAGTLPPLLAQPYGDGYRAATALLGPVVIHCLFWLRTGPRPLRLEEASPSESVRGPG